jgi:hypothetical protein
MKIKGVLILCVNDFNAPWLASGGLPLPAYAESRVYHRDLRHGPIAAASQSDSF